MIRNLRFLYFIRWFFPSLTYMYYMYSLVKHMESKAFSTDEDLSVGVLFYFRKMTEPPPELRESVSVLPWHLFIAYVHVHVLCQRWVYCTCLNLRLKNFVNFNIFKFAKFYFQE